MTSETLILLTIVLMTQSCHCRCYHGAQCLMIRGDQHAPKYLTNSEPLYFWDTTVTVTRCGPYEFCALEITFIKLKPQPDSQICVVIMKGN